MFFNVVVEAQGSECLGDLRLHPHPTRFPAAGNAKNQLPNGGFLALTGVCVRLVASKRFGRDSQFIWRVFSAVPRWWVPSFLRQLAKPPDFSEQGDQKCKWSLPIVSHFNYRDND